jgi:hypothetical protein
MNVRCANGASGLAAPKSRARQPERHSETSPLVRLFVVSRRSASVGTVVTAATNSAEHFRYWDLDRLALCCEKDHLVSGTVEAKSGRVSATRGYIRIDATPCSVAQGGGVWCPACHALARWPTQRSRGEVAEKTSHPSPSIPAYALVPPNYQPGPRPLRAVG